MHPVRVVRHQATVLVAKLLLVLLSLLLLAPFVRDVRCCQRRGGVAVNLHCIIGAVDACSIDIHSTAVTTLVARCRCHCCCHCCCCCCCCCMPVRTSVVGSGHGILAAATDACSVDIHGAVVVTLVVRCGFCLPCAGSASSVTGTPFCSVTTLHVGLQHCCRRERAAGTNERAMTPGRRDVRVGLGIGGTIGIQTQQAAHAQPAVGIKLGVLPDKEAFVIISHA